MTRTKAENEMCARNNKAVVRQMTQANGGVQVRLHRRYDCPGCPVQEKCRNRTQAEVLCELTNMKAGGVEAHNMEHDRREWPMNTYSLALLDNEQHHI